MKVGHSQSLLAQRTSVRRREMHSGAKNRVGSFLRAHSLRFSAIPQAPRREQSVLPVPPLWREVREKALALWGRPGVLLDIRGPSYQISVGVERVDTRRVRP